VFGIDNNQRAMFFGPEGDTSWSLQRLLQDIPGYDHYEIDIRDREGILRLVESTRPIAIVHTAAQPSHDRASEIAFDDFDTNAVGTLNLVEAARRCAPQSPFIYMSTNEVYVDSLLDVLLAPGDLTRMPWDSIRHTALDNLDKLGQMETLLQFWEERFLPNAN
jgi:CDP-paratose 2-epimerase